MENQKKIIKITAVINKGLSASIIEELEKTGIAYLNFQAGRSMALQEKKRLFGLINEISLAEDPVEILTILVDSKAEDDVLSLIIEKGRLNTPGNGSVYSEDINLMKSHELCLENNCSLVKEKSIFLQNDLVGICCIVQKGQGNQIARAALDTGVSVPIITYGEGTGLRNKIGLLRITIPAEKEVINVLADSYDAEGLMNLMIDIGKLDQPGKGFIYLYPVRKGLINTKINSGNQRQVASIEQIVSAIDELKGNIEWRRKSEADGHGVIKRAFLSDLMNFSFVCDEGQSGRLIKAAMNAGAAGATISKMRHLSSDGSVQSKISPAREFCNMIISPAQTENIIKAIEKEGGFGEESHGQIQAGPVLKACTFLGK